MLNIKTIGKVIVGVTNKIEDLRKKAIKELKKIKEQTYHGLDKAFNNEIMKGIFKKIE